MVEFTVHVYEAPEMGGMDSSLYVWDFGAFTCVGDKESPHALFSGNMHSYHASMAEPPLDADWKAEQEPVEETVEIYEYDFGVYCETMTDDPEYIFFDGTIWWIKHRVDHPDNDDDAAVSLKECRGGYQNMRTVWQSQLESLLDEGEATPLIKLQ